MPVVCLYFQVHQPCRLRHYSYFDINRVHTYEDGVTNRRLLNQAAEECYLPANRVLLDRIRCHAGAFRIAFSLSVTLLEQLEKDRPDVLESYRDLADTGCVEFLNETSGHSLSFLFSPREFRRQVLLHRRKIRSLFHRVPTTFCQMGFIYNDHLVRVMEKMGCRAILAEGAESILNERSPDCIYRPAGCRTLKLLLRNHSFSDELAFLFSTQRHPEDAVPAKLLARRIHSLDADDAVINLLISFERFGEHDWASSGVLEFLQDFPSEVLKDARYRFQMPAEAVASHDPVEVLEAPEALRWTDQDKSLTAWLGNAMQKDAIQSLYNLEDSVRRRHDRKSLKTWRMLQASDHFRFMGTKGSADDDVHQSSSPYFSPYDAYINYMNILDDFSKKISRTTANPQKEDDV